MILIKQGVVIASLQSDRILEPAYIADRIWKQFGWGDVVITGGIDGNHMANSSHYRGLAIDLRLPSFYSGKKEQDGLALMELQKAIPSWRVLMEGDHLHIQKEVSK